MLVIRRIKTQKKKATDEINETECKIVNIIQWLIASNDTNMILTKVCTQKHKAHNHLDVERVDPFAADNTIVCV